MRYVISSGFYRSLIKMIYDETIQPSPRQVAVILYLEEKGALSKQNGISNSELCRELNFTKSACSQVLKKLEAKGLVASVHREGDRLRRYWHLVGLKGEKFWNKEKLAKNKGLIGYVAKADNG